MVERYQQGVEKTGARAGVVVDEGLRAYMLRVYNYMASGVLLTGIISLITATTPAIFDLLFTTTPQGQLGITTLGMIVTFSPLVIYFTTFFRINKISSATAHLAFWAYASLMGLSMSYIFYLYTAGSIAMVFFLAAATFGGLSLFGYTTKKDLSSWGTFLIMGIWGLFLVSLATWFFDLSSIIFWIAVAGVFLFSGFTAFFTQQIKNMYYELDSQETGSKKAIFGAFFLYLSFMVIFRYLLIIFGNRN